MSKIPSTYFNLLNNVGHSAKAEEYTDYISAEG